MEYPKNQKKEVKYLLAAVNAKYIHSNLAIYSLTSYARAKGMDCDFAEYTINQLKDEVLRSLYELKPQVLGFSCYIWNMEYIGEIIENLSVILPETRIWLGGPEVSLNPSQVLEKYPFLAGIMAGEGEETYYQMLCRYEEEGLNTSLSDLAGLYIRRKDGEIHFTGKRELLSMDELVFPYDKFDWEWQNRILYYESSRGCPFSCSYCLSSVEKGLRFKSLELVYEELDFFLSHKVPQVKFIDRTFNCNHKHAYAIWEYIATHDNGITNFHFEISADLLNDEELALMSKMRKGLIQLEIGVQTTNPDTIQAIGRHMDLEKLAANVKTVNSFDNIHQHLDLIAGLPYEDMESFQKSFDRVYEMESEQLQLGFLKVLHGTRMEEEAARYEIRYHARPVYEVLSTTWMSYEDLLSLKNVEETVEEYYNSGQFCGILAYILPFWSGPFSFYQEFGQALRVRGYRERSLNRADRYMVLYDYLMEEAGSRGMDPELIRLLLSCDYLRRERLKQIPDFLVDQKKYLKEITAYYASAPERFSMSLKKFKTRYQLLAADRLPLAYYKKGCIEIAYPDLAKGHDSWQAPYLLLFDYEQRSVFDHNAVILADHI